MGDQCVQYILSPHTSQKLNGQVDILKGPLLISQHVKVLLLTLPVVVVL